MGINYSFSSCPPSRIPLLDPLGLGDKLHHPRPLSVSRVLDAYPLPESSYPPMFPWLARLFCFTVVVSSFPAPTLAVAACEPKRCGNVTVSPPFGVVWGAEENPCAQLGFQVHCTVGDIPCLGYYEPDFGLQILEIFYANASLIVSDVHKLTDFSNLSAGGCHVPTANTASKIGHPFAISPRNRNLVFYSCSREPAAAVMKREGLVGTVCHNNTFVRAGGGYGEPEDYALDGCEATAVPVMGPAHGETNASDYMELISDGFLLTWQPRSPSSGE